MEGVRVISTTTIQAPISNNANSAQNIDLTPWDLQQFAMDYSHFGLLYRNEKHTPNQIEHLQQSLSSTLAFFSPLVGRLVVLQHDDNIVSSHIVCNNEGALFVHAVAGNTTVADILQPKYVPPIVRSFFQLNGVHNYEGTSKPLLAVQVTELVDGIFIGMVFNHMVADGKSFWHFVNSWAEISRSSLKISKLPTLERYFPDGVDRPIRFPFTKEEDTVSQHPKSQTLLQRRVFHFTKEKLAELKSKANAEVNTDKISSLQALLTLLWRSVTRCRRADPKHIVFVGFMVGVGSRMVPPLAENYFGNAVIVNAVSMKAGELLEGGLGKGALEINKVIYSNSHEKMKNHYESWVKTPRIIMHPSRVDADICLGMENSPRFDVYGNDFGWGKPVAFRSGEANNVNGKMTVSAGAEEGSIQVEVNLSFEILEEMGNDLELMDAISN